MKLAEYKSIAKVGDNVKAVEGSFDYCDKLINGNIGKITKIDDDLFYINGCSHSFSACINNNLFITLLDDDTLDWRTGKAPIPREELRVGMRVVFENSSRKTTATVSRVNPNSYDVTDGVSSEKEWNGSTNNISYKKYRITLLPSPDTEWHALTESNICDFLAVGDTVEVKWDGCNGNKIFTVDSFRTGNFLCGPCREGGRYMINERGDNTKFRLIKKGTAGSEAMPEVEREDTLPHVYTREDYAKVARVGDVLRMEYPNGCQSSWEATVDESCNGKKAFCACAKCRLSFSCNRFVLLSRAPEVREENHNDAADALAYSLASMIPRHCPYYNEDCPMCIKKSSITKPTGHNKLMQVVTNLMKTVANSLLKDEDKAMRA